MNWYLQSGKESDIAINTRIRFSRNIQGYNFHLSPKELQELENKIKDNIAFIKSVKKKFITPLAIQYNIASNHNFLYK